MTGIFDTLLSILNVAQVFLPVILVLVVIHELGHFVTAKLAGVDVQEFGVGFPPKIVGKRFGSTEYTINWLPLGGFVRMLGEEDPTAPGSFASKSVLQRSIILCAGPGMNLVLAVVLMTGLFMANPVPTQSIAIGSVAPNSPAATEGLKPGDTILKVDERSIRNLAELSNSLNLNLGNRVNLTVDSGGAQRTVELPVSWHNELENMGISIGGAVSITGIAPDSPAAVAGLKPGDRISKVAGAPVASTAGVQQATQAHYGEAIAFDLIRDGQPLTAMVTPRSNPPAGQGAVGIQIELSLPGGDKLAARSLPEALVDSVRWSTDFLSLTKNSLYSMVVPNPKGRDQGPAMMGPVGIAVESKKIVDQGFTATILLLASLSMNLAVMNILPIPALDGGRLMFVLLEWVRRGRRIAPEREGLAHMVGFAVLMSLMLLISFFDIQRILGGAVVR